MSKADRIELKRGTQRWNMNDGLSCIAPTSDQVGDIGKGTPPMEWTIIKTSVRFLYKI